MANQMWVFRFRRDGQPREIHTRRRDLPQPRSFALRLAQEIDGPVDYTPADISGVYDWQRRDKLGGPLWSRVDPADRRRRIEACPNGCADTQPPR